MERFQEKLGDLTREGRRVGREARERAAQYLLAAFGLVAGLAWNEAIRALIEYFFPASASSLVAKFLYAGGVTLVVVLVSVYLIRVVRGREDAPRQ